MKLVWQVFCEDILHGFQFNENVSYINIIFYNYFNDSGFFIFIIHTNVWIFDSVNCSIYFCFYSSPWFWGDHLSILKYNNFSDGMLTIQFSILYNLIVILFVSVLLIFI